MFNLDNSMAILEWFLKILQKHFISFFELYISSDTYSKCIVCYILQDEINPRVISTGIISHHSIKHGINKRKFLL